jgi:outer membrane protein insertion porin family
MAAGALAQDAPRVVGIDVVGNRVASKSLILGVTAIDLGSPLTPTAVQESIHRLYSLGIFRDINIRGEDVTGGIKIIIEVDELPKLTGLEFEGNDKFKDKDLIEKLGLGVGGYISPFLVYKKKEEIRDLYAGKGYFQADVSPSLTYNTDSTGATLLYRIEEHSKVKVEKVIMTGNLRVAADDLIGKMRNRKRGFLRSSDFAQDKYDEDLEKVIGEYHKKGFIDAYMISDSMTIDSTRNRMTIFLEVYEGPMYYFGDVTIVGNDIIKAEYLESRLKFGKWDIFDSDKYQESLVELYTAYQEVGHLHARINDERTTVNDSILNIDYTVTEGLPSSINLVRIVGNKRTKDKVIRREMSVVPGQTFNRSLLIRSVRDVMALNYFSNVEPVPIDLPNGDVDLEFKVEEKQTGQVSAGAGYNSQDKLVGTLGMGIPNFRGMGQNVSFNVEFGSRRNSFSVSFTEPWAFGRPTLLGTDLYSINRRWFEDYTESRQGGALRLGRRLRWPDNYFRVVTSYRLERTRYNDFDDAFVASNSYNNTYHWDTNESGVWGDSVLVDTAYVKDAKATLYGDPYPGSILEYNNDWRGVSRWSFSIIRDSRNLPEFATNGSRFEYTFSQTGGPLGGYYEYQKHQAEFARFFPIIGNLALAAKVQVGAVRKASNDPLDNKILLSDRFTPGGTAYDGIVRGYDDGVLTPDSVVTNVDSAYWYYDPDAPNTQRPADSSATSGVFTTRVRGKYMIVSNIELQYPILPQQLYMIAFWDAGNSWLRHTDIQPFKLYSGMGLGFRLMVPGIGTIGFDFAKPLQNFDGRGYGWHAHFQIGTTFR